jgi:hypothetical protein
MNNVILLFIRRKRKKADEFVEAVAHWYFLKIRILMR